MATRTGLAAKENTFFHEPRYAKRKDQVLNQSSRSSCFDFFFFLIFASPSAAPQKPSLLSLHHFLSSYPPSSALAALRPSAEGDPWALQGQVIQGHWRVISADWLTSKRTSGRSQSGLAAAPPPGRSPPLPFQLISSLCHMTRARRQREDD